VSTPRQGEPEIWFVRDGRAYVPCHWKAVALALALIGGCVAVFWALLQATYEFELLPDWAPMVGFVIVVAAAMGWWLYIAERHSADPP